MIILVPGPAKHITSCIIRSMRTVPLVNETTCIVSMTPMGFAELRLKWISFKLEATLNFASNKSHLL